MEALELYREENRKKEEHKYACENAGKEVETSSSKTLMLCSYAGVHDLRGIGCRIKKTKKQNILF